MFLTLIFFLSIWN